MRVFLDTIGCRLNQSEIEQMAAQLRAFGHEVTDQAQHADIVIINTCAVTDAASSDSRHKARQAARAGATHIILTGCYATIAPQIAASLPNVKAVISNQQKDRLIWELFNKPQTPTDLQLLPRQPLPGAHQRTRAFIKVQDGCDNHCTYCITRIARGKSRSRAAADVPQAVLAAHLGGVQEVVLTGAHLGSWGKDLAEDLKLADLLETLLEKTAIPRIRLSSLEPWDIDDHFLALRDCANRLGRRRQGGRRGAQGRKSLSLAA
jgi:threonylcarbamoyladenosine tRNA methylthiotransferase MtaB